MKNKALLSYFLTTIITLSSPFTMAESTSPSDKTEERSRFERLKTTIFEQPYATLPTYKVKRKHFGPSGDHDQNKLLQAARRTFDESADLIEFETGQKLLNANGICFSGRWQINHRSPFTGLYQKSTDVPVIVRASVALSGTRQRHKRAFGMAIKLLPNDLANSPSLNVFVLHSMGGKKTKHVLDLSMDNAPPLGRLPNITDLGTALRLRSELEKADKENGNPKPSVSFRPISHLANYDENDQSVVSPKWLRLSAITPTRRDEDDFRDELNIDAYPDKQLRYSIEVAGESDNGKKSKAIWQTIGELQLTDSVTSLACDTRLHFQHPRINTAD